MGTEQVKTCSQCKLELPLSNFKKKKSGYIYPRCNVCSYCRYRITKTCKHCEKLFETTNKTKLFCTRNCSDRFHRNLVSIERHKKSTRKKEQELEQNRKDYPEIFEQYANYPSNPSDALKENSSFYFTGLKCRKGHIGLKSTSSKECTECIKIRSKIDYDLSKADGRFTARMQRHKERLKERRDADPEFRETELSRHKKWAAKNRDHLSAYERRKRIEDPQFAIKDRLQTRFRHAIRTKNYSFTVEKYCGCSIKALTSYLENNFVEGMSWEAKDKWEIDHLRPCKSFDLTDEEQAKTCFNWRNLRPLWSKENRSKKDSYEVLDETEWVERMISLGYEGELFLKYEEGNSY